MHLADVLSKVTWYTFTFLSVPAFLGIEPMTLTLQAPTGYSLSNREVENILVHINFNIY